ncbi:sensor histidine kinase [Nonomuraea sediminis]|uniref:sensor histidine kinase n=1 Tax=Nonomuraea sediminis TaxID=2835864 RepID=UPI001BDBE317|nr:HAMP domain-containing sensor histidine kinase [Nonomuraea sediminis]
MRSVRARVTLAAIVVAALALGLAAAILAVTVPRALRSQVIDGVEQAVQWQAADARLGTIPADLSTPPGVDFLQIIGPGGQILGNSPQAARAGRLSNLATPQPDRVYSTYGKPGRLASRAPYYIAAMTTQSPRGQVTVYAAEDIAGAEQAIRIFYLLLAFAFPVLLLMVAGGAWAAVGNGLRPVERIRSRLADITASDLGRRVPVPRTDDEIAALATTTNDTLSRMERSAETQRKFVSDASHELRSPIAALCTQLDLALAYPDETDWPEVCRRAREAAHRLSDIIEELLMMARLDAGAVPDRKVVNLSELAAVREGRRVPLMMNLAAGTRVYGSPTQLDRLLTNLLDNADRHAATRVDLSVAVEDGSVVLTVTDDGNGIAPEDRERVFERFIRLKEGRERDTGGSGLGLALAREIAAAHHGTLAIADHSPGARFVARFPLAPLP